MRRAGLWLIAAMLAFALLLPPALSTFKTSGDAFDNLSRNSESVIRDCRTAYVQNRDTLPEAGDTALNNGLELLEKAIKETDRAIAELGEGSEQYRFLARGYRNKLDLLQRIAINTATR